MTANAIALTHIRNGGKKGAEQARHENLFALAFGLFAALLLSFALIPHTLDGADADINPIEINAGP